MLDLAPDQKRFQNFLREKAGVQPIPDQDTMLCCCRCNTWKPDNDFYRHSKEGTNRGRRYDCKLCNNEKRKRWRTENRDREMRTHRAWRRKYRHAVIRNPVDCPGCGEFFDFYGMARHKLFCSGLTRTGRVC